MSDAKIIDGKAFAAGLREQVAAEVARLSKDHGIKPCLTVILVGEDPASQVYVRNKGTQTEEAGMTSVTHRLDASTPEDELLALIESLNKDTGCNGILVQLPLPDHIDESKVLAAIEPDKDVDGFHVINVGRLWTGQESLVPCTPYGCLLMLKDHFGGNLSGKRALVLGRSNIVGKPMAALLLGESCTVSIAHSRTQDLAERCREADILVAAVGRPEMVQGDWLKPGAVVIDVGVNSKDAPELPKGYRLCGDVDFESVKAVAGAITPVPGGVGPMTIAMLLKNTVNLARHSVGLPRAPLRTAENRTTVNP